ncbi:hypothetical protein PR048_012583 [Dryococelus australis]|uniref:Uncharacterized protein n=1 Tax=Dryococelus australis TaxID=614101 RepID=A0ABQ9HQ66_9NEOP|nr:hypothetical protein PR048_012583 [Dryococelus australis]
MTGLESLPQPAFDTNLEKYKGMTDGNLNCSNGLYLGQEDVHVNCNEKCLSNNFEYKFITDDNDVIIHNKCMTGAYCLPKEIAKFNLHVSSAIWSINGYLCVPKPELIGCHARRPTSIYAHCALTSHPNITLTNHSSSYSGVTIIDRSASSSRFTSAVRKAKFLAQSSSRRRGGRTCPGDQHFYQCANVVSNIPEPDEIDKEILEEGTTTCFDRKFNFLNLFPFDEKDCNISPKKKKYNELHKAANVTTFSRIKVGGGNPKLLARKTLNVKWLMMKLSSSSSKYVDGRQMKVQVPNRYWDSFGGEEGLAMELEQDYSNFDECLQFSRISNVLAEIFIAEIMLAQKNGDTIIHLNGHYFDINVASIIAMNFPNSLYNCNSVSAYESADRNAMQKNRCIRKDGIFHKKKILGAFHAMLLESLRAKREEFATTCNNEETLTKKWNQTRWKWTIVATTRK